MAKVDNAIKLTPLKSGLIGLEAGACFGAISVIIGQPFDTVKTKMQVQEGLRTKPVSEVIRKTWQSERLRGFYQGSPQILIGSAFYRSLQFGAYNTIYTYLENKIGTNTLSQKIGGYAVLAGFGAATTRSLLETPLEYTKIRKQTQRRWHLNEITAMYRNGFGTTLSRNAPFLITFFFLRDQAKERYSNVFSRPYLGPFLMGSVIATFAWLLVWPLDVVKSQVQGSYGGEKISIREGLKRNFAEKGFAGLYRGAVPGLLRSFCANGIGLIIFELVSNELKARA